MPDSTDFKSYRKVLQNIFGKQVVTLFPRLAHRFGGATVGLMLSQLLFYDGCNGAEFPLKVETMHEQTGLTQYEQGTARDILVTYKAIKAVMKGFPKTWHYTVDLDRIEYLLANPQIQVFPDTDKTSKRKRQYLLTTVYGEASDRNFQKLGKPAQSSGKKPNLNEGAINDLKPQINSDKDQEEEAPAVENFACLDADLLRDLRAFKVFESKLPIVDQAMQQAGWTPAQVRELMVQCRQQDRRGSPAALFLTRIQELKPTSGYDYSQYIPQPETEELSLEDLVWFKFQDAMGTPMGHDLDALLDRVKFGAITECEGGMELRLICPEYYWKRFVEPNAQTILDHLRPLGIVNVFAT